ncbi:hypothetical protein GCM10009792_11800 [Microcella alkalica]|uniref:HEAT repeat protein n=1 Tax=Microcella alkalica TaxID=355930 RepID=A0A839EEN2_9MICO|nr:HEAT repeat domain-containing protein [Microcella alkalica]MBA8847765.1 HEAT repeat protein [Microcella alkalica]
MTALLVATAAAALLCLALLATVLIVRARIARLDERTRGRRTEVSSIIRALLVEEGAAPPPRSTSTLHAVASVVTRVHGEDREALQSWLGTNGATAIAEQGMRDRRAIERARAIRLYVRTTIEPSAILMMGMLDDPDPRVRGVAALEWGSTGRTEAIAPVLAAACREEHRLPPLVASIAIMRCRLLDVESLHAAWSTRDPDGLRVALSTGSAAGLAGVQPYAIAALDDDDPLVRIAAADALRRVGTRRALKPLNDRLAREANPIARRHLDEALTTLGGGS